MGPIPLLPIANSCNSIRRRLRSYNCISLSPDNQMEDVVLHTTSRRRRMYVTSNILLSKEIAKNADTSTS